MVDLQAHTASRVLRLAVITGAGRGIGRSTSIALASAGYQVALLSRTLSELHDTADVIRSAGGIAHPLPADVTDEAAVTGAFAAIRDLGSVTVLVNNAGGARFSSMETMSLEDWEYNLRVNLTGTFLCCRAAIPLLERGGHIVNVASSAAKKGYSQQGAYAAAKHGVLGLSRTLCIELKDRGIHVHTICPGAVATRLAEEIHPGRDKSGWMTSEEIAQAILFLTAQPPHLTVDEMVIRRFDSESLS